MAQYTYEPYGQRVAVEEPGMNTYNENVVGHQGLFIYRLNYGHSALHPETTGLYYNRNRWLAPHIGRFLQKDPAGTAQRLLARSTPGLAMPKLNMSRHFRDGMNLYAYLKGGPLVRQDAMGLETTLSYGEILVTTTIMATLGTAGAKGVYHAGKQLALGIAGMANNADFSLFLEGIDLFQQGRYAVAEVVLGAAVGIQTAIFSRKLDIKKIDDICNEYGLSRGQRRKLHDEMGTGQWGDAGELTLDDIREIAEYVKRFFPNL